MRARAHGSAASRFIQPSNSRIMQSHSTIGSRSPVNTTLTQLAGQAPAASPSAWSSPDVRSQGGGTKRNWGDANLANSGTAPQETTEVSRRSRPASPASPTPKRSFSGPAGFARSTTDAPHGDGLHHSGCPVEMSSRQPTKSLPKQRSGPDLIDDQLYSILRSHAEMFPAEQNCFDRYLPNTGRAGAGAGKDAASRPASATEQEHPAIGQKGMTQGPPVGEPSDVHGSTTARLNTKQPEQPQLPEQAEQAEQAEQPDLPRGHRAHR
ncbi:MAG: hypothetical protein JWQ11_3878 [Rhizobacter sp.]|nr:hypothetical protein [Rhizobacter sp.]